MAYKYLRDLKRGQPICKCLVIGCNNDSVNNDDKAFFRCPPLEVKVREQWFKKTGTVPTFCAHIFCCEDHFELRQDCINFGMHYAGVLLKLRNEVVPHKNLHRRKKAHKGDEPKVFRSIGIQCCLNDVLESQPKAPRKTNASTQYCILSDKKLVYITSNIPANRKQTVFASTSAKQFSQANQSQSYSKICNGDAPQRIVATKDKRKSYIMQSGQTEPYRTSYRRLNYRPVDAAVQHAEPEIRLSCDQTTQMDVATATVEVQTRVGRVRSECGAVRYGYESDVHEDHNYFSDICESNCLCESRRVRSECGAVRYGYEDHNYFSDICDSNSLCISDGGCMACLCNTPPQDIVCKCQVEPETDASQI